MNFNTVRFRPSFMILLLTGIAVNASGLFMTILEPDAAFYAGIAKSMALSNDFINLKDLGVDWLDKPHFPFWVTALSYKLLGYSSFAYRLPAFLFWLFGMYYTWKFAKLFYTGDTAKLAVLIYVSVFHLIVSNSDVRAEPYLTGMVIAAVYHFYKASKTNTSITVHLFAGALFAALSLMTKGLFTLGPVTAGLIFHWMFKKEWNKLFQWRWIVAFALICLFTLPELYCLYVQFDLHPEKTVFGRTNVSGIRFFLWDSQFGRFFSTGPYKGKGDFLFYVHTLLWAFLPWSLLLYAAFYSFCQRILKKKTEPTELICFGAGLFSFLLFSFSSFQLPHYLNIVFPFYAVLTAQWLVNLHTKKRIKLVAITQIGLSCLLLLLLCFISYLFRFNGWWLAIALVIAAVVVLFLFKKQIQPFPFLFSFIASCLLFVVLNLFFYPALLQYQSGTKAANYMNRNLPAEDVFVYELRSYSFEFYVNRQVRHMNKKELQQKPANSPVLLFTNEKNLNEIIQKGYEIVVQKTFTHFHISRLNFKFLNAVTREGETEKFVLIRVS